MVDFGHDESAAIANAAAEQQAQRRKAREESPIRCPGCKRTDIEICVGQYSWNTQDYTPSDDDWNSSDYDYEGDIQIGAYCRHCEYDLTLYLLRKGWRFSHDIDIPNRAHEKPGPTMRQRDPILWAQVRTSNDEQLKALVAEAAERLGRLLDEQERRKSRKTPVMFG